MNETYPTLAVSSPNLRCSITGFPKGSLSQIVMSHYYRFELCRLIVLLLLLKGIEDVMANTLFVSHRGRDHGNSCNKRIMPCQTVRHAVTKTNEGDRVFIDFAQGRPYKECEDVTKAKYPIELTKSISFHGMNGSTELQCSKWYSLFKIKSPGRNITHVKFINLIISNSNIVVRLDQGALSELVLQNLVVRNNQIGLYGKNSIYCSILMINATFERTFGGIHLQCLNLTANIMSGIFKSTPVLLKNIGGKPSRWQNMQIWVENTGRGKYSNLCRVACNRTYYSYP